jgi:hypothetical protein
MLRKEFDDRLKNMSYEKQKEMLDILRDSDKQAYDDSCNVVEVVVYAVVDVVKVIGRLIFK